LLMEITASMVKELRERTGAGMMDCKRALVETEGDFDKAVIFLREKGPRCSIKACREGDCRRCGRLLYPHGWQDRRAY